MAIMTHNQYKEICLSIKNDISFDEFKILCSSFEYTDNYIESIWNHFSNKPLEFVLYHDLGKEIFEYIRISKYIIKECN
jgi:hypothetical protein